MEPSITGLKVLRAIAECGSFSAAAVALGYTQSAVSRQMATLEREAGAVLCERRASGTRLTSSGLTLLRHALVVLDEIALAESELEATEPDIHEVRLGVIPSAGSVVLPPLLRSLRIKRRDIRIVTREGTTPALVRALRARTLDLAVLSARSPDRPPDDELPALTTETVDETTLMVAVASSGRFAGRRAVSVEELETADWIASPMTRGEPLLGVWPGLPGRFHVAHTARDWLTKLSLVAADCGVTTVAPGLAAVMPEGVTLVRVENAPEEHRRIMVARMPGSLPEHLSAVVAALTSQASQRR